MPSKLTEVQEALKSLNSLADDFAEWIIENHDKATRVERDKYHFTFEFDGDSDEGLPDLTCKFWVANDSSWLHLEVNEMQLDIDHKEHLWDMIEEIAEHYPIRGL